MARRSRRSRSGTPRPAQSAASTVRKCPICKKQKSTLSFDEELGTCIKCKYNRKCSRCKNEKPIEHFDTDLGICTKCRNKLLPVGAGRGTEQTAARATPRRTRTCPVCVQKVSVALLGGDWTIEPHKKARNAGQIDCTGSGAVVFAEKRDALDHTVSGSFEGGKRR